MNRNDSRCPPISSPRRDHYYCYHVIIIIEEISVHYQIFQVSLPKSSPMPNHIILIITKHIFHYQIGPDLIIKMIKWQSWGGVGSLCFYGENRLIFHYFTFHLVLSCLLPLLSVSLVLKGYPGLVIVNERREKDKNSIRRNYHWKITETRKGRERNEKQKVTALEKKKCR